MVYWTSQKIHQNEMGAQQQLCSNVTYVMSCNMHIWSIPISRFVFELIGCLLQLLEE